MYFRIVENAIGTQQEYVTKEQYDKLLFEYQYLKQQLADLKRMIFGSKSERFVAPGDTQMSLFDIKAGQAPEPEKTEVSYQRQRPEKEKKNPIRVALPAHLPRIEEIIEPEGVNENDRKIGEEITEILEYSPAQVYVRKIIRPKYVKADKQGIVIAELPSFPIPKGNAGPSMLAWLSVSKFIDHLPFYRQIEILKRQGLTLSDSTVNGWFNATIRLLVPLYDTLEKQLLTSDYLQADESPIGVQDTHKKGALHTGYHWVYRSPLKRLVLFKYHPSREQKAPQALYRPMGTRPIKTWTQKVKLPCWPAWHMHAGILTRPN